MTNQHGLGSVRPCLLPVKSNTSSIGEAEHLVDLDTGLRQVLGQRRREGSPVAVGSYGPP